MNNMKCRSGFVYIIKGGERHKIGRTSRSVAQRLSQLQTGSPLPLTIAVQITAGNAAELENSLHEAYQAKRVNGTEWFDLDANDLAYLASSASFATPSLDYAGQEPIKQLLGVPAK